MSIASQLTALAANKAAIKAAIEAQNPSVMPTDALSQWPTSIASISGGAPGGWIYGYSIDTNDPDPSTCVTYIADNADYSPLHMDFANDVLVWGSWKPFVDEYFRPAMLTSAGVIDYYLDPDDLTKKADGVTASDVSNASYDGNAMVIVKPIWWNVVQVGSSMQVRFSNVKQADDWNCWTHLKSDGSVADFCGWACFLGRLVNGVTRSLALNELATTNRSVSDEEGEAEANGANWYKMTWADEQLIRLLFPLFTKSLNCNDTIGGRYQSATSSTFGNKSGELIDKGAFYGKRIPNNGSTWSTNNCSVKFLHMEGLWGERWRRPAGLFIDTSDGRLWVKMTPSQIDGSTVNGFDLDDRAGYVKTTLSTSLAYYYQNNECCPKVMSCSRYTAMMPSVAISTTGTFYLSSLWGKSNNQASVAPGVTAPYYKSVRNGLFGTAYNGAITNVNDNFVSMLSYHSF